MQIRAGIVSIVTCLFTVVSLCAQSSSELDQLVHEGRDAMYRLEYSGAREIFGRVIERYPESPVGYGMMSIATWNEMLYAAANPTLHDYGFPNPYSDSKIHKAIEAESRRFHEANDQLLLVAEGILETDPENVLALYFEGLAYENLAAEAIAISNDRWGAVGPGREAAADFQQALNDALTSFVVDRDADAFARTLAREARMSGFGK